jgi:hypothetical protein
VTKTILRCLIVAEILIGVTSQIAFRIGYHALPEDMQFDTTEPYNAYPFVLRVLFVLGVFALASARIYATIGLWRFWRYSRPLYLVVSVAAALLILRFGTFGLHLHILLAYALGSLAEIVAGVIIGIIYFSPLKSAYEHPPAANAV